jgi:putative FmdB family regulatory protein
MPIYEYLCAPCNKRVSLFFRSYVEINTKPALCPECGDSNLKRLISIAGIPARGNNVSDSRKIPQDLGSNEPQALANTMRSMMNKSGQDYGNQYNEVVHRLEKGEDPNSIESSLRKRSGEDGSVH